VHGDTARGRLLRRPCSRIRPDDLRGPRPLLADPYRPGIRSSNIFEDDVIAVVRSLGAPLVVGRCLTINVDPRKEPLTTTSFGTMPRIRPKPVVALFTSACTSTTTASSSSPARGAHCSFSPARRGQDQPRSLPADPDRVRAELQADAAALGGQVRIVDWQQAMRAVQRRRRSSSHGMFLSLT